MHMNKEVEKTLDIIHTNQHLMADNLPTGWNTAADSTIFWSNFVQIKSRQKWSENIISHCFELMSHMFCWKMSFVL